MNGPAAGHTGGVWAQRAGGNQACGYAVHGDAAVERSWVRHACSRRSPKLATGWISGIALLLLPPLAYCLTYRICLGLQRHDREVLDHGIETGIIRRLPHGEFIEVHQLLGTVDDHGHPSLALQGARVAQRMNQLGAGDTLCPARSTGPIPQPKPPHSKLPATATVSVKSTAWKIKLWGWWGFQGWHREGLRFRMDGIWGRGRYRFRVRCVLWIRGDGVHGEPRSPHAGNHAEYLLLNRHLTGTQHPCGRSAASYPLLHPR